MKKITSLICTAFITLNAFGQSCGTPASPAQASPAPASMCGNLMGYIPANNVTIPVNFIFFKPLTGPGKFDTVTQGTCIDIINFMNQKWGNLSAPTLPLPNPYTAPTNYTDTKIRFSFKSISFKYDAQYGTNGPNSSTFPAYSVTDPYALNLVFNVNNGGPVGKSWTIPSNYVTNIEDASPGAFGLFDGGARHLYFLHEVGHALGLYHTFDDTPTFSNPNGTILPPPPMDDYWLEDNATTTTQIGNNWMGSVWIRGYISPKQIAMMHYQLKSNPMMQKLTNSSCSLGSDWAMGSNTYSGLLNADANLIIPTGNHVTLTGCVFMKPGTKIIVEPGAKLSILNGKVTSACGDPWQGIEVQSNPGGIQSIDPSTQMPNSSVGMLELNGATIENAEIGVNVGKYNSTGSYFIAGGVTFPGSWIPYTGAGIVFSENSKYENNRIAVNFNPYYVWTASGADNLSYFKKDEFRIDSGYVNANDPFAGININTTFKIDILGSYFTDRVKMKAIGIRCFNGSFNVKDHCSNQSGPNCNGTLTSTLFRGFKYGIFINNWIMNTPSVIRHIKIDQRTGIGSATKPNACLGGIFLSGTYGTEIVNSEFYNVKLPGNLGPLTYGVYLDGCDGYVVENNYFEGYSGNGYLSGAIFVNNSGPGANSIYNNTIQYHQQGIWSQNINYDTTTTSGIGLVMNCNDFLNCKYNIGVQAAYTGPVCVSCPVPVQPGGVSITQGVTNQTEDKNVRNTYHTNNCADENKFYINTPNAFVVTSHGSFPGNQFHPTPQPNCSNGLELVDLAGNPPLSPIKSSYCAPNYFQSFSKAALSANISTSRADIISLTTQLTTKLDGGSTQDLLNLLSGVAPVIEKFETLQSKDFLSDAVLQAFFGLNEITPIQIEQIFTKNAPVHPTVWKTISNLSLDETLHNSLSVMQFDQNRLSERELIQSQLTLAKNQLGLFNNEKIRRFLSDTAVPVFDSIVAIYDRNEMPNSALKCVDLAIATNHFAIAEGRITALRSNSANEDICNLFDYILDLHSDAAYAEVMRPNSDIRTYLKSKSGSDNPLLSTYAKTLLAGVYGERDSEITLQPENVGSESERRGNFQEEEKKEVAKIADEKFVIVFPNPASEKITVQSNNKADVTGVEIVSLSGSLLIEQICDGLCKIDVSSLQNGVYLLNLYKASKILSTKKLIIIK